MYLEPQQALRLALMGAATDRCTLRRHDAAARSEVGVDALELFVEVLSQSEDAVDGDGFYDRLCEAVCRLAQMRRALIFRYDIGAPAGARGGRARAQPRAVRRRARDRRVGADRRRSRCARTG